MTRIFIKYFINRLTGMISLRIIMMGISVVHDRFEKHHADGAGFSETIARELVHRRAVSEVLITGMSVGNGVFNVYAQWPRWHVFYGAVPTGFDSALIVETLRQLTVAISHAYLGVPFDRQFLMPDMKINLVAGATFDTRKPADVSITVDVSQVRRATWGVASFRTAAKFKVGGQLVAEGSAGARLLKVSAYDRIRSRVERSEPGMHSNPVQPENVGHRSLWNVVLAKSNHENRWPLRVDVTNPILFDHPLDHVPGALLIEACRQAVRLGTGWPEADIETMDAQFMEIVEFNDPSVVVLNVLEQTSERCIAEVSVQSRATILMRSTLGVRSNFMALS